jgi:hypothetical protein
MERSRDVNGSGCGMRTEGRKNQDGCGQGMRGGQNEGDALKATSRLNEKE